MKFKGFCIALLFVLVFSIGFNIKASVSKAQPNVSDSIKVLASNTDLKIGEPGYITIKGKPGTQYTIRTSYNLGDRTYEVNQMRLTDKNGKATFNWFVSDETKPGTNTATITGDGEPVDITHTVTGQ